MKVTSAVNSHALLGVENAAFVCYAVFVRFYILLLYLYAELYGFHSLIHIKINWWLIITYVINSKKQLIPSHYWG